MFDTGHSSNLSSQYLPAGSGSLPRPPTGALRPPVAVGPADGLDVDSFHRRGFVDRNASMSHGKVEDSGWTPWNNRASAHAAEAPAEGPVTSGGWGIAEIGFEVPQMAGMPAHMPGPAAAAPTSGRRRRSGPEPAPHPRPVDDDERPVGLQPRVPSVRIDPMVEHVSEHHSEWGVGNHRNLDASMGNSMPSSGRRPGHRGQTSGGGRYVESSEIQPDPRHGPPRLTAQYLQREYAGVPVSRGTSSAGPSAATFILTPPPSEGGVIPYDAVSTPGREHWPPAGMQVPDTAPPPPRQADAWSYPHWPREDAPPSQVARPQRELPVSYVQPQPRVRSREPPARPPPEHEAYASFAPAGDHPWNWPAKGIRAGPLAEPKKSQNWWSWPDEEDVRPPPPDRSAVLWPNEDRIRPPPDDRAKGRSRLGNLLSWPDEDQVRPPPDRRGPLDWPDEDNIRPPPEARSQGRSRLGNLLNWPDEPPPERSYGRARGDMLGWPDEDRIRPPPEERLEVRTLRPGVLYDDDMPPPDTGPAWPKDSLWNLGSLAQIFSLGGPPRESGQQHHWPEQDIPMAGPLPDRMPASMGGAVRPYDSQPRPYQVYHSAGAPLPPSAAVAVNSLEPAPDWPEEAWTWKSLFSALGGSQKQAPQPPMVCAACGNVFLENSRFCRKCGAKRPLMPDAGPMNPLTATPQASAKQPSYKTVSSWGPAPVFAEDSAPTMSSPSGRSIRPPGSLPLSMGAPEVPAYREQLEQRKHAIEIDLDEVCIFRDTPDLVPEWHESTTFYCSLHPCVDDLQIPSDPPKATKEGEYLVSKSVQAREVEGKRKKQKKSQHVQFKEKLILTIEHPFPACLILLWGRKGNIASESFHLLGKTVISLFDYSAQRKLLPWNVLEMHEPVPIAELFMKYEVRTTPAAVQLLHLTDVQREKVTLHWTKPLNDHGSPIQGYKIDILVSNPQTGPQWHTLCPCTKTLYTSYVVENLTGNTEYVINVSAVNAVGEGDRCEFNIQTAPIQPSPPEKPWIQEARDGCLCVAWHASTDDGGTPITSYKVQMMKLVGGTANPLMKLLGPGEKDAAWADIGSVGAVMDEMKDQPSIYTVWAGPLDHGKCEYRFRVYAMNNAGVSPPSELCDPHYTS